MKLVPLIPLALTASLTVLAGCSSSSSTPSGPVIDSLDVPATTTQMTLGGQTGPGVIVTLTAHDDDSGIAQLHCVFTETNQDQPVSIPNSPTDIAGQQIELVVVGAPSGSHPVAFHLTDAAGRSSAVIQKTITVP